MNDIVDAVNNIRNMVDSNLELKNKLSSMFSFIEPFSNKSAVDNISNTAWIKNLGLINYNEKADWSSILNNQFDWLKPLQLGNNSFPSSFLNNHLDLVKSLQPISDIQRDEILDKMGILQSSTFLQNNNLGNILSVNSKFTVAVEKLKFGFPYSENIKWEKRLDLMEEAIDETLSNQENSDFPPKAQIISVFRKILNILNNTYTDRNIELTSEDIETLKHVTLFLPVISLLFANKEYADIFFKFYILWLSIFIASNDNK